MRLNKTKKRQYKLNHKTKRSKIYGSGKTKSKLRANVNEFIPSIPSINNVISNMSSLHINNTSTNEFNKMKERIENAVAIDCEMVGVGYQSALAHIAIVDFNGNNIYNKYVIPKYGIESITNYRTKFSGITPEKLVHLNKENHSFEKVKNEVHNILDNRIIVGHGLINDFKVLDFIPNPDNVWDTTEIDMFKQNNPRIPGLKQPRKLKAIAKEFANNNIQLNTKIGHSPLEDARASMNLYRISFGYPKIKYDDMSL